MKRICVYCGSNSGLQPAYAAAAEGLGQLLAEHKIELVYGGGRVGLMGVIANAVLRHGGHVIGVIPHALKLKEVAHEALPDLRVVNNMHERKALLAELADGFIALPGGFGTSDEFCEILTWSQLGLHRKPVGFLDVAGFYRFLWQFFDHATAEGFIRPAHREAVLVDADATQLLAKMRDWKPATEGKWVR